MIIWYNWIFGTTSGFARKYGTYPKIQWFYHVLSCFVIIFPSKVAISLGVRHVLWRVAVHRDHHHLGVVGHHSTIWEKLGNSLIDTWPLKSAGWV